MQAVHVDVACAVVRKAIDQQRGVQAGHQGLEFIGAQAPRMGRVQERLGMGGIEQVLLRGRAHIEHAALSIDGWAVPDRRTRRAFSRRTEGVRLAGLHRWLIDHMGTPVHLT